MSTSHEAILQNIKQPRSRWSVVTSVDGKIYAFGGKVETTPKYYNKNSRTQQGGVNVQIRSSVDMYDPLDQSWKTLPPMDKERRTCACAVIGTKIYVVGGHEILPTDQSSSSGEVFDTITESFTTLSPNIIPRWGCTATAIGNKIYVFGGLCEKSAEVYDVYEESWTRLPDMSIERYYPISVAVGNKIYVIGGSKRSSMEVFDTVRNKWYRGPSMKRPLNNGSCNATLIERKIVVFGNFDSGQTSLSVDAFDIRKKAWKSICISPADIDSNFTNATASVIGNDVYLIDESSGLLCLSDIERLQLLHGNEKSFWEKSVFISPSLSSLKLERILGYVNYVFLSVLATVISVIIAITIIVLPAWLWEEKELNASSHHLNINSTIDRVVDFIMDPIFPL